MRRSGSGFTVIEATMAMCMISVALLALMHSVLGAMALTETNRQDAIAMAAARQRLAQIQGETFGDIFKNHKDPTKLWDDSNGILGGAFNVEGMDLDGAPAGQVVFPMENGNLSEMVSGASFKNCGMPRDLDGDGVASKTNVSSTYKVLPVKIRIRWRTVQGIREAEFVTMLTNYK